MNLQGCFVATNAGGPSTRMGQVLLPKGPCIGIYLGLKGVPMSLLWGLCMCYKGTRKLLICWRLGASDSSDERMTSSGGGALPEGTPGGRAV